MLRFSFMAVFAMVISLVGAQNVGIGTNLPASSLSVKGGLGVGSGSYSESNAAPTNGAIIEGNVGIGLPNPSQKLDVVGAIKTSNADGVKFYLTALDAGSNISHTAGWSIDYNAGPGNSGTTGQHRFFTTDGNVYSEKMRISSNGNVGIGITSGGAKLDVNGLVDARYGLRTERRYNYFVIQRNANGSGYDYNLGNWDYCALAGSQVAIGDDTFDGGSDNRRFDYECTLEFNDVWALPGWTGYLTGGDYGYTSRPNWHLYSYSWAQFDQHMVQHCNAICVNFDY